MKTIRLHALHGILVILCAVLLFGCNSSKGPELGLIPVKSGDKWQYIDKEGKIVINPQFSYAAGFFEGLALIRNEATPPRFGYIDEKGIYIINATYITGTSFSEGLACVVPENGSPTYIDTKGQIKFTLKDAQKASLFREGMALFSQLDKEGTIQWGYVDNTGTVKIIPQFSDARLFSEGMAAVANKEGKWGFIDAKGSIVINYQFEGAGSFRDGLCIVYDGKQYGYIEKTGKYKINPQFEDANPFSEGKALVAMNGRKYGYIDSDGKILINPQFDNAQKFLDGKAAVANGGKWGYIDEDGKFIINTQFDWASSFFDNMAFIVSSDKVGIIDTEGKYIVNPQFDDINRDVLTGETIDRFVETDYYDASPDIAYGQQFIDLFKQPLLSGTVLERFKGSGLNIYYSSITFDTVLTNKSHFSVNFSGESAIKSYNYWTSETILNTVPIQGITLDIRLSKNKAKLLFDAFKNLLSGQAGFSLDSGQSNDESAVFTSQLKAFQVSIQNESVLRIVMQNTSSGNN